VRRPATLLAVTAVVWSSLSGLAAGSEPSQTAPSPQVATDIVPSSPVEPPDAPADPSRASAALRAPLDGDPLGLVAYPHDARRYSLTTDHFGVYVCTWPGADGDVSLAAATALLNSEVTPYFTGLSGGAYQPTFIARKVIILDANPGSDLQECADEVLSSAEPDTTDNAAFAVMDNRYNGGLATSGMSCYGNCTDIPSTSFPENQRWAVVDGRSVTPLASPPLPSHLTTSVHEIGHTLTWPHSYSGVTASQYDNPVDVMSANSTADGTGRADDPYATIAFNRYRSGWIDPGDVVTYRGGTLELTIAPVGVVGTQMVVLPTDDPLAFLTLDARIGSAMDAIPEAFEGVTAHFIVQICDGEVCSGTESAATMYPPWPNSLEHVTATGQQAVFDLDLEKPLIAQGTTMTVLSENVAGFQIRLVGFDDIGDSIFAHDIIWLATAGITKGCGATGYCPDDPVTRGQMAAFLVRSLDLTVSGSKDFVDDDDSIFEADIERLAAAGITRGCNPPENTRFCPNDSVTRGQMAAFLVRALGLTDTTGATNFIDDDDSIFEADIERLAAAGITRGCNPPENTRFCPHDLVTREQMAAFLRRALDPA